jgi:F-type H+-transporting ATPase subunit b
MLLHILAQEEDHNPILPPLSEIIVGFIAFAILAAVLMKYVFPRMEETFQARREAIEGGIRRAEEAQAEARRLLEQYRQQLADARTEAAQIRDAARAEAQHITDEMRAQAQAEQARIVQRGEEMLAAQRQQIVRELRTEIGSLAVDLAERIVGASLADDVRQRGTVDRFVAELEGMSARAPVGAPAGDGGGQAAGRSGSEPGGSGAGGSGSGGSGSGGSGAGGSGSGGSSQRGSGQSRSRQGESRQGESRQGESRQGESRQGESGPDDSGGSGRRGGRS